MADVIFYSPVAIPATQPTVSKQGCCPCVLAHSNYIHVVEWQVTLCDPIWHVSSSSGVATSVSANCYIRVTLLYKSVEERLEFGLGRQLPLSGWPRNPATTFWPPSTTMVSPESLPHCAGSFQCLPEETFLSRLQNFVKISKELWMQSFKNRYVHKNTDRQTETTDLRVYPMHWIDKNKTTWPENLPINWLLWALVITSNNASYLNTMVQAVKFMHTHHENEAKNKHWLGSVCQNLQYVIHGCVCACAKSASSAAVFMCCGRCAFYSVSMQCCQFTCLWAFKQWTDTNSELTARMYNG